MSLRSRGLVTLGLLVVGLVSAVAARADVVQRQDTAGRTMTFDVLDTAVDVDRYAQILSAAAHGNEISAMTLSGCSREHELGAAAVLDPPAARAPPAVSRSRRRRARRPREPSCSCRQP